ncbi:hypothetical protein KSS87_023120 [Heliosperma pusillum]|nr:hypothetical protein KSS87_023120 [Heliosperma pusillum]
MRGCNYFKWVDNPMNEVEGLKSEIAEQKMRLERLEDQKCCCEAQIEEMTVELKLLRLNRSVGRVLALAFARELSPVVTPIVVAGRIGSAFAAELGTMQVSEQTDTLRVLGANPADYLVTPRVLASCIALPFLTLVCFIVGMAYSAFLAESIYGVSVHIIMSLAKRELRSWDIISAMIKSQCFIVTMAMAKAMLLSPSNVHLLPTPRSPTRFPAASFGKVMATNRSAIDTIQSSEDAKEKIRQMFQKVELSVSAYDTAWVAMSPSPTSPSTPCFPGSLDWILQNQLDDGSWGLADRDPSLGKDILSSTLACVLALKTWGVGEQQIRKGVDFIVSKFTSVMNDEDCISPIGFDVIFPSLIEKAFDMDVNLGLPPTDINAVLQKKDLELNRIQGHCASFRNLNMAYISEALGKSQDWGMVMAYQQKNGSLFNSPSTTAAAFTELKDSHCHSYLCSVLQKFGNAVPTLYPADAYFRLYMVDILEKTGISRHFKENISQVLNETFSLVCAELLADKNSCISQFGGNLEETRSVLELFRASQMKLYAHESYLDKNILDCRHFLEGQITDHLTQANNRRKNVMQEIADTLKSPYHASLDRIENSICSNFFYQDLLQLAKDDFNYCQSIQKDEFTQLQRWVVESKLDKLTFSRQKLGYCYFSGAATMFAPELAEARISWAKNGVLTTVVDDFFDVGSCPEEQLNLIQLLEEWGENKSTAACSENVEIVFSAVKDSIYEIGQKAREWQDRDVTKHLVEIWLSLMKSMWTEAEMSRNKSVPTMEEYMANAYISFALGPIVLPALYFIGPKLSEKVITSAEYQRLFELMSTCGRLLNDIQGFQRESEDGKLNAISLRLLHSKGSVSKDGAIKEFKQMIDDKRGELLRWVLSTDDDDGVPRECKEVFWKMCKVVHFFYLKDDGFTSDELKNVVKSILRDPI